MRTRARELYRGLDRADTTVTVLLNLPQGFIGCSHPAFMRPLPFSVQFRFTLETSANQISSDPGLFSFSALRTCCSRFKKCVQRETGHCGQHTTGDAESDAARRDTARLGVASRVAGPSRKLVLAWCVRYSRRNNAGCAGVRPAAPDMPPPDRCIVRPSKTLQPHCTTARGLLPGTIKIQRVL